MPFEPKQNRQIESPQLQAVDQVLHVDATAGSLLGWHGQVP